MIPSVVSDYITLKGLAYPTQASAQECAKSMMRTSWIRMKKKPPIMPKYIQTSPEQNKIRIKED